MPSSVLQRARRALSVQRLVLSAALAVAAPVAVAAGALHVPSPDWRDAVIYFAMIDRFDDGDASNNDQGAGEFDPRDGARYSGGDLAGLTRRLDYIKGLGASALWITPPVEHQWWNTATRYGGYHGYWAHDFKRIDPHFGMLADYRALSKALHARGMHLVQDVVVNHVANYTGYVGDWNSREPARHFVVHPAADGRTAPARAPFALNDVRNPAHRAADVYHWTPDIRDYADRTQELDWQLAGLDDLNTENPAVRAALRDVYGFWIREAGVDAFRVDTALHVPAAFFPDFLHADDAQAPGVARVAAETGRADFLSFGEGFGTDKPFDEAQARKLDAYMRTPGGLPSMINFPLYGSLGDVFARGRPTAQLAHRIESTMRVHADPWRMPNFVDNHDVDRFLAGGTEPALKQALLATLTLPGIPVIYYGTEQGFTDQRAAMFAGGYRSGGRDRFDTQAPLYRYLRDAIALRRGYPVFSRGTPTVLASNGADAGAIAWRLDYDPTRDVRAAPGERTASTALIVLNSADVPVLLDRLDTRLPPGTVLEGVFAIDGADERAVVAADGTLTRVLPPRSGSVWRVSDARAAAAAMPAGPTIDPLKDATVRADFEVRGAAPGMRAVQVVVDGRLDRAQTVPVEADGRWQARVRTGDFVDPALEHRVVAFDPARGLVSSAQTFRVEPAWRLAADRADPRDDDRGRTGRYLYPNDAGWRDVRPADVERVRAWTANGALRVEVTMRALSRAWNPANGFDHVVLTGFVELPGQNGGSTTMPLQNASLPDGMRWHRRWRAHGWSNALFAHDGASPTHEGAALTPVADLAVGADARTLTFTFPARSLGDAHMLDGARVHITTWDYDGGYRPLAPEAGAAAFGGAAADAPKIMDSATVTLAPGS
ncbi:alpha-amylase family glycosyl hydrolase [Cognatilysobacter bugurensis]|uniref:Alpha-amylase n=1 Tax=Cognatilysobacter bugurensis TaxID=543356 RepID=A0A918T1W1_9GAMM|nr:alpha-amylase family glycosyl hydrolase [Lysobacter bugurensis]GHA81774.1 alpha-amylase [Lysobacter bugurensis]